ncbi:hypothetical protein SteCoe_7102 [Stentor coeruleus]|uniref:Glucosamine 6-phosphate N-acetyltransferase n=1 Tax=Stentor coeruleus TaxID=5963 RepID=A0A1R2CNB5_9CILI|nr:hypothetical protein SteCoe_7102 [Stentor coeruleus]
METFLVTEEFTIRRLKEDDFHKEYKPLLEDLTIAGDLNETIFKEIFDYHAEHNDMFFNIVIEENATGLVVGNGMLVTKPDIKRNGKKLGFIEDIVVRKRLQGKGLGKKIIDTLLSIAREQRCYKVILDCGDNNEGFYNKCGFHFNAYEMSIYF